MVVIAAVPPTAQKLGDIPWPLGVILLLVGLGIALFPREVFQSFEAWKYQGTAAAPSLLYNLVTRTTGIVLIYFGYRIITHS